MKRIIRNVGLSVILLVSFLAFAIAPVAAQDITASRTISDATVAPGDTFTVTVDVDITGTVFGSVLNEDVPAGWTVTEVANDGGTYNPTETSWLWSGSQTTDKTAIYTVTVPDGTTDGSYDLTGTVLATVGGSTIGPFNVTGDDSVTVAEPVLTTITVDPATLCIGVGGTQTFTATTLDQYDDPIDAVVAWDSSNTAVGTIDASTGVFMAVAAGTTTVNATNGSVTGTVAVTVILKDMNVTAMPDTIYISGATNIIINVTDVSTSAPINGASVTLEFNGSEIANGTTIDGECTVTVTVLEAGTINVTVTASGYNAGSDTVTVEDWNPWDDDCVIGDAEISMAEYYWATSTLINGHLITDPEISLLEYQWATGDVC